MLRRQIILDARIWTDIGAIGVTIAHHQMEIDGPSLRIWIHIRGPSFRQNLEQILIFQEQSECFVKLFWSCLKSVQMQSWPKQNVAATFRRCANNFRQDVLNYEEFTW